MRPPSSVAAAGLIVAIVWLGAPVLSGQGTARRPAAPAFRIIELSSGRTLSSGREDLLSTPVLPGSIVKVATLIAALETGVVGQTTRMICPREVVIDGRRVTCSHPDVGRPIGPAEALAHSCNAYFANVAARLRREALDRVLVQLGLPPTSPVTPLASAAVGLDGTRVPPDRLLGAFVRFASGSARFGDGTRRVVLDGLRGAAEYGTASVFRQRGISALAKTGTAPMPAGGFEGLLVAVTPADRPARGIVVMAPGGAGFDAARIAAELLGPPDGAVRIGTARGGGYDVSAMALEEYVGRVVSAEAAAGSGIEARKALAIAARTFAVRNRGRHAREGFDLCDLTHCQVVGVRSKAGDEAAAATSGHVLEFAGRVADVYYTASCGGHSERPSAVWPGAADLPYLLSRPEPECRSDGPWQSDVTAADLQRALAAMGRRGQTLRNLAVAERSASGRASRLRVEGYDVEAVGGDEFRMAVGRTLGWQVLKSTLFDIERTATGYRFRGSGRGHGVGLCVVGSSRLAANGRSAREILTRYFPGTDVRALEPEGSLPTDVELDVVVPAGEEKERQRVQGIARSALREFSSNAGVPVPQRALLVFHPTVEAYVRASGKAWWTAGAARGNRIDFIPLSALRERGLLEQTLRHELAHVMTRDKLAGRPIWVQEAVAMSFAGDPLVAAAIDAASRQGSVGRGVPGAATPSCPTDAEWRAIRSAQALEGAYERAAACFAAQSRAGRRWDEVR
jgi:stage II sporulation protein D